MCASETAEWEGPDACFVHRNETSVDHMPDARGVPLDCSMLTIVHEIACLAWPHHSAPLGPGLHDSACAPLGLWLYDSARAHLGLGLYECAPLSLRLYDSALAPLGLGLHDSARALLGLGLYESAHQTLPYLGAWSRKHLSPVVSIFITNFLFSLAYLIYK